MPEVFKDYQFSSARIVGGLTLKESLPYQLKLVMRHDGSHWCGATLISSKYATSAAHCFYGCSDPGYEKIVTIMCRNDELSWTMS